MLRLLVRPSALVAIGVAVVIVVLAGVPRISFPRTPWDEPPMTDQELIEGNPDQVIYRVVSPYDDVKLDIKYWSDGVQSVSGEAPPWIVVTDLEDPASAWLEVTVVDGIGPKSADYVLICEIWYKKKVVSSDRLPLQPGIDLVCETGSPPLASG